MQNLSIDDKDSPSSQSSLTNRIIQNDRHEEDLYNTIEQLIHQYMCHQNRRHPYWTRVRWFFDDGTHLGYHVSLSINEERNSP